MTRFVIVWAGEAFPLREGENIIGRAPTADVRIDASSVSRRHCSIRMSGDSAEIQDLGSKNGTFVGKNRIDGCVPLASNTDIRLGSAVVHLVRRS